MVKDRDNWNCPAAKMHTLGKSHELKKPHGKRYERSFCNLVEKERHEKGEILDR